MKFKQKSLLVLLTIISVIGTLLNANITSSSTTATVYVDPSIMYASPGEDFTLSIRIEDVADLHTWQVGLYFDASVLSFTNVSEGDFLRKGGKTTYGYVYADEVGDGYVMFTWSTEGMFWESGSGTLATVDFEVLQKGESRLNITNYDTTLIKMNPPPIPPGGEPQEEIPFTPVDGLFFNIIDPPMADFTYSPSLPGINETVTFDASASNTTAPFEISEYQWNFGDGTMANETDPVTTHSYLTGGVYNVSLIVIDNVDVTGTLIEAIYNMTTMPQEWFERFGKKGAVVDIKLAHNIAVTQVAASPEEVTVGDILVITVTVLNKGTETEDFNVIAYYADNALETKSVTGLSSGEQDTLTFNWDTTEVAAGTYEIWAEATDVVGEASPQDNEFVDGDVTVTLPPEPFPTTLVIVAVVGIVVIVAIAFVYMRRRG